MKLSELKQLVNRYCPDDMPPHYDCEVVVQTKPPFSTIGGTPFVKVDKVYPGFDWDQGKFFLITESPVVNADVDFGEKFRKLQDDCGWLRYENRDLKRQINQLKKSMKYKED